MSVLQFTAEVESSRQQGIGASEIGQLIGLSPYGGPHAIWLLKTGRAKPFEGNEYTRYGSFAEAGIREHYAYLTGHRVVEGAHMVHPRYPLVRATPDALVNDDRIAQIKCVSNRVTRHGTWGEPGTHDFPKWLWPQITWEMAVTGRQWADVVMQLAGHPTPFIYPDCPFDEKLFDGLREAAERFWRNHVLADKAPPLDGTDASSDYVKSRFPEASRPQYVQDASPEMDALVRQYVAAKDIANEAERTVKAYYNQIAAAIGSNAGIEGPGFSVSYSTGRRMGLDWEKAARDRGVTDADMERYVRPKAYRTMRVRHIK